MQRKAQKACLLNKVAFTSLAIAVVFYLSTFSAVALADIKHQGFVLQGLSEHKVIDTSFTPNHQQSQMLSNKLQTIKLLTPELKNNRSAIQFHICEKGITPDTGSCTQQRLARTMVISQDTLAFGLKQMPGKAGLEHTLYLSIFGKTGGRTYYQEVNNTHFIFPQDHYELSYKAQKLNYITIDGFSLEPDTQEIRFDIKEKRVMQALKADKEVTRFSASLYTVDGQHIKDLRVYKDNPANGAPYSIKVAHKNTPDQIQLMPGSYLLHIDYPYTAVPLSTVPMLSGSPGGLAMLHAPNGFIVPVHIWGNSQIKVGIKLPSGGIRNLANTELQTFRDAFYIRSQPRNKISYKDDDGWVYNRFDLEKRFTKAFQETCQTENIKELILEKEGVASYNLTSPSDFESRFKSLDNFEVIKNTITEEKVAISRIERISGEYERKAEIKCRYQFTANANENNSKKEFKGNYSVPLILEFSHDNVPMQ